MLRIAGRNIAWKSTKNLSKMKGSVQILGGRYPKDRTFLLVIHDLSPSPSMKNVHPTDRLHLADPPQVSLSRFQILMPQDHF